MITDINDSIIHLSRMINKGKVKTVNNKLIDIDAETICIHGDQPNAQIFAKGYIILLNQKSQNDKDSSLWRYYNYFKRFKKI